MNKATLRGMSTARSMGSGAVGRVSRPGQRLVGRITTPRTIIPETSTVKGTSKGFNGGRFVKERGGSLLQQGSASLGAECCILPLRCRLSTSLCRPGSRCLWDCLLLSSFRPSPTVHESRRDFDGGVGRLTLDRLRSLKFEQVTTHSCGR